MGQATPPPPIIGDLCVHCNGVLWPAGQTPKHPRVTFADLVKCPLATQDPPDGTYMLTQDAVDPCKWEYSDSHFLITLKTQAGPTWVACTGPPPGHGNNYFYDSQGGCASNFANDYLFCLANIEAHHGTAHVDWI